MFIESDGIVAVIDDADHWGLASAFSLTFRHVKLLPSRKKAAKTKEINLEIATWKLAKSLTSCARVRGLLVTTKTKPTAAREAMEKEGKEDKKKQSKAAEQQLNRFK